MVRGRRGAYRKSSAALRYDGEVRVLVGAIVSLSACSFSGGSSGGGTDSDAGNLDAPDIDACDQLELRYRVNDGEELLDVNPEPMVLRLGDSIVIDGATACGREGAPEFSWSVPPEFAGDVGSPTARIIRIAPIVVGTHVVDLEVSDSVETRQIQLQVETRGIQYLPHIDTSGDDCNGLTITTGSLWAACNNGTYRVNVEDPYAPGVGNFYPAPVGTSLTRATRVQAEDDNIIWWIDNNAGSNQLFRYDVDDESMTTLANADTGVVGNNRHLMPFPGGIRTLTNNDIWTTGDSGMTWNKESDRDAETAAINGTDVWSADNEVVHVSSGDAEHDVFPADDDNIRGMVFVGDQLFVGGDEGAAILDDTGQVVRLFNTVDEMRQMVIDPITGDVWAGSNGRGLYRYSLVLQDWMRFSGSAVGLESDNIDAVVVDNQGGRDAIYLGTNNGLHVLTTAFEPPPALSPGDAP